MVPTGSGRSFPVLELRRKVFHICLGGLFMFSMVASEDLMVLYLALFVIGAALSIVQKKCSLPIVGPILERFDRAEDRMPGMGIMTFFFGVLLVWVLFPLDAALAGCAVMTFGDPVASIVGLSFGRFPLPLNRRKTLEGTLSFILTAFIVVSALHGPLWGATAAIVGGTVESIKLPKGSFLNDNVTVPISSALAVHVVGLL